MKLLFYIQNMTGGGAQRVMANLLNDLAKKGYDISLACDTSVECMFELAPDISLYNLREGCRPSAFWKRTHLYRKSRTLFNIRKIAKRVKPDVAISFMTPTNCDVILSLLGSRIPVIVSEHITLTLKRNKFTELIIKYIYPLANAVTLLTRYDYNHYKNKIRNAVYMPNPSDPPCKIIDNRKGKVIFAAGSLDRWYHKGFDLLIQIWSELYKDFPDWELNIAGHGSQDSINYLESMIETTNCGSCKLLGFRKDVNELMQKSEVYCMTSRFEGLPMTLIEAMNAGCCCLSFDCKTGPSEIINNGFTGILVADKDVDQFREKLREVLDDDTYRHYLSSNSYKTVIKYRSDKVIKRWTILFNKLVNEKTKQ